jgi:DNA-binding transcriptional LysR family regulator
MVAMETFVRVVEAGSFSAAAQLLNVGQPAVSKSVAQLEDRLGVRLLIRSTRGLTPTEAGQNFYERARRVVEEADEAEQAARGTGGGLTGRLRVSAATTFASLRVLPRLPEFMAAHPELAIDLVLDDRVIDLVEAGIDVALRMGALDDSAATARKLAAGRRLVLGAPAYFARAGVPANPAALLGHEAVIYMHSSAGKAWSFRQGGTEVSVNMSGRLHVSAAEGMRAALLAGIGLAVSSEWMFAPELARGEIQAVLTDWTLPGIDLWALFPTGRMASAKARAFAEWVEGIMRPSV